MWKLGNKNTVYFWNRLVFFFSLNPFIPFKLCKMLRTLLDHWCFCVASFVSMCHVNVWKVECVLCRLTARTSWPTAAMTSLEFWPISKRNIPCELPAVLIIRMIGPFMLRPLAHSPHLFLFGTIHLIAWFCSLIHWRHCSRANDWIRKA